MKPPHGAGVGAGRGYKGFCGAAKPFNIEPNPARLHARAAAQKSPARGCGGVFSNADFSPAAPSRPVGIMGVCDDV